MGTLSGSAARIKIDRPRPAQHRRSVDWEAYEAALFAEARSVRGSATSAS
jgi:hypothetical protein